VFNIYSNTAALKKAVVFYFLGIKKLSSSFSAGGVNLLGFQRQRIPGVLVKNVSASFTSVWVSFF
jgi:hypothetical protein